MLITKPSSEIFFNIFFFYYKKNHIWLFFCTFAKLNLSDRNGAMGY